MIENILNTNMYYWKRFFFRSEIFILSFSTSFREKRLSSTPDLLFFQIWRVWGRWWLESELTKKFTTSHFMDDMPIQIFENIPSLARVSTIFFLESDRCGEFNNIFCIRMIAKGLGRIILFFLQNRTRTSNILRIRSRKWDYV